MELKASEKPDYSKLIDEEIWAFIHKTQQCFPDDTTNRPIKEQRAIYNAMCRVFFRDYPEGVHVADDVIVGKHGRVPVRRYEPEAFTGSTVIIYMHGGGFVVGDLNSHDDLCAEVCARTGFRVTSVDYRLSPEHKHPAAFEDCLACAKHEANTLNTPVLLCGDSAGGNLAAAVAQCLSATEAQEQPVELAGQVLLYPDLGGDTTRGSRAYHANAPMLTSDEVAFYLHVRVDGSLPQADPSFLPLHATDFSMLPRTVVISAECDPLADDGKHYCEAIVKSGGHATWKNEPGLVHGFLRARHSSKRARASFERVIAALKELGSSQ